MARCCGTGAKATLNRYWRPTRNPGSVEDFTERKEYLEHLTYHGGLDASVWKRTAPQQQSVDEKPAEGQPMSSGLEEKMVCYWKANDACTDHILPASERVDKWLERTAETEEKEPATESSAEKTCSCSCTRNYSTQSAEGPRQSSVANVKMDRARPSVENKKPVEPPKRQQAVETVPVPTEVPKGPASWMLLFSFLFIIMLYRLFMAAEPTKTCVRYEW